MAAIGADKMDDLEDGEISGSDSESEMGITAGERVQPHVAPGFMGQSFQSRPPPQTAPSVTSYRNMAAADSSESDSDSDEGAVLWKRKRQRCSLAPPAPPAPTPAPLSAGALGRRVNNIWGSVVQEQSQEAVAAELGIMGMEGGVSMSSRQCETYNYVLARKLMEKERQEIEEQQGGAVEAMLDGQLDEYMEKGDSKENGGHHKRKRPAKERLGPRAEMDITGRYEIAVDDPEEKVADEIAHRLMEPKKVLIERVVRVIGKKKAIELLVETASIEQDGGLYTMDGSRRRTPGGVYLNLLKHTPSISSEQIKEIFLEENQRECSNKKAAKKRRRHEVAKKMKQALNTLNLQEHDDISRETFASDTNEALESLDEAPEGPAEAAQGTEDTPVVYSSSDLEVF
ncbi:phosphorylated adapter RNA export protein [Paramormyrops kingsleyae]|uniref:Phosphorylated adapter RNA export protein n=1 Tax=Paramormyrops kingsleyae TaxID=1676925 RepID=A0A3B3SXS2_9TELE|nr:phosphorylated adapter RNA export protein [Paramormyrops kingsleyae]